MPEKQEKEWKSGYGGKMYPGREEKKKKTEAVAESAAGDAPPKKGKKGKEEKEHVEEKGKGKEEKGKGKEEKGKEEKGGKGKDEKGKDEKGGKGKEEKGKDEKGGKGKGKEEPAKVDQAVGRKGKKMEPKVEIIVEPESVSLTPSQIAMEEAEHRAMIRKQNLRKRPWPEVTKVKINTKPWSPPGPPEKPPKVMIDLPPLKIRNWVPPWMRQKRPRPKLPRILPEPATDLPEGTTLKKVWHGFTQVDINKMMIRGTIGCNSKRYSSTHCGAQTGCIAFVARALLDDKTPAQLVKRDVDDVIEAGDRFYKQCTKSMKCYKGKPALELKQILPDFFFRDYKYTVHINEEENAVLAKHPDNVDAGPDLLGIMEKYIGKEYMFILTVNHDRHFLIWGHPPDTQNTTCKTICYIFDPHMMDEWGIYNPVCTRGCESCGGGTYPGGGGAGAFLRYPGITSFVLDFLANYCSLEHAKKPNPKPPITLTSIEVAGKEPIFRWPGYDLDLKTLKPHCPNELQAFNINAMVDDKRYRGKYPFGSLSAESLAMSRKSSRYKVRAFFQKLPKEPPPPTLPVPPEKPPPAPTTDQLNNFKGEDFFLYCPRIDAHTFGRDDNIPLAKSEQALHSLFEIAEKSFDTQYDQIEEGKWILRGTRHFASYRYQLFLWYTGVACCVAALAMLRKHRARGWNEDYIDETCDVGWNIFRESLMERHGPIRRLVLGELKTEFSMRDKKYEHKERGIAVWGKLMSKDPKVFDICRGVEAFFKESDSGILQIPGEFETAIWYEGGKYYMYHPWPADRWGRRVGLQGGGKACLIAFSNITLLCEHFLDNVRDMKRKPYSISDVGVYDLGERPEPVNNMKAVGPNRWIVRGSFHEGDERFAEEHRNKQGTPNAIAAIAMASLVDPAEWTSADIDEILTRGDVLYEKTMENLDKMGINLEQPPRTSEENEGEEEEGVGLGTSGTLAAADVLPRFNISEYDCIETEILDSEFSGQLNNTDPNSGMLSLKDSLKELFKHNNAGVVTARGGSVAVWKHDDYFYFFDPHACDEYGLPSEEPRSAACLLRMKQDYKELADVIMGNLAPGSDDSFNISPVEIMTAKLNPELGAPEIAKEGRAFEWLNKHTATILMGPRGENSALGKAAFRCSVPKEDLAGRTIALPAIAAFAAATDAVPPPGMHQDHMFNFLEAGGEYYLNHVKTTGRKDITVEDLSEKFEMGVNTFSIEVGEPTRLPLRLPDKPAEGGGEEEEAVAGGLVEGEEPKEVLKEMKELLFKMWYDNTKPHSVALLVGDYHQLGVWIAPGGKVVAFDPAPTLAKGLLTPHRIRKGDELREQRIKDERVGEVEEEEPEDEGGGEEAQPEVEEFVPPESCPVLMIFASPAEFIDKLVLKGGLNPKQAIAPYWLYPVTVTNELTSALKEKKPGAQPGDEEAGEAADEEEALVEPLEDEAMGKYFQRKSRTVASMRGAVAQNEIYFMDQPNRDNQDPAVAVMGIIVHHIEPYTFWKPSLVDAILKYGDRLYTLSLPNAKNPPRLQPDEIIPEFHVTAFNVRTEIEGDVIAGDYKAGDTGSLLNLKRGLKKFLETYAFGVICAKNYCIGVWKGVDDKSFVYWDPHTVGPTGKFSPASAAGVILFSTLDELAETFKRNLANLNRPGPNKYTISSVKVFWEFSIVPSPVTPQGATPDEGYEWKVLTAFVEVSRGRTILRGSPPVDLQRFCRDAVIASAPTAIVAACMANIRKPHLWTRKTIDEIMCIGCKLFQKAISTLGYEFRPGEDILLPLQVPKKFCIGVNYVKYDLQSVFTGRLETRHHQDMTCKSALEKFFSLYQYGIFWSSPYAVAVWRVPGAPGFFMMEPHACGPNGLRPDGKEDGAACCMTFTSPKLLAHTYLQNLPPPERYKRHFVMYAITVDASRILPVGKRDPPLVRGQKELPKGAKIVPATSKVDFEGKHRHADEMARVHPPGEDTWADVLRAMQDKDKGTEKLRGIRNSNGWLVLVDGSQFLSASHSMACRRYPYASRGNQALACSVMAVAMSAVEEVCRWCNTTLDQILDSGDQLYQDSFLHYQPRRTPILAIEQILRKFYTPGNCVCRVVVYKARQTGSLDDNLTDKIKEFFREERAGVFVAYGGEFAVALFKSPRGFYMFDPADRDRYGRAVAPQLVGRSRACFSQWPTIQALAEQLKENIGPATKPQPDLNANNPNKTKEKSSTDLKKSSTDLKKSSTSQVRFEENAAKQDKSAPKPPPNSFAIYGMGVSSLRRLNTYEQ